RIGPLVDLVEHFVECRLAVLPGMESALGDLPALAGLRVTTGQGQPVRPAARLPLSDGATHQSSSALCACMRRSTSGRSSRGNRTEMSKVISAGPPSSAMFVACP